MSKRPRLSRQTVPPAKGSSSDSFSSASPSSSDNDESDISEGTAPNPTTSSSKPTESASNETKKRSRGPGRHTRGCIHPKVLQRQFLLLVTNIQKHPSTLVDIYLVLIIKKRLWKYSTSGMEALLFRHQPQLKICEDLGKLLVNYKHDDKGTKALIIKDYERKDELLKLKPLRGTKQIDWNSEPPGSEKSRLEAKKIVTRHVIEYLLKPLLPIENVTELITVNNESTQYDRCVFFICLLNKVTGTNLVTKSVNLQDKDNQITEYFKSFEETISRATLAAVGKLKNNQSEVNSDEFDIPMLDEHGEFLVKPVTSNPIVYNRTTIPQTQIKNQDPLVETGISSVLFQMLNEIKEVAERENIESVNNIFTNYSKQYDDCVSSMRISDPKTQLNTEKRTGAQTDIIIRIGTQTDTKNRTGAQSESSESIMLMDTDESNTKSDNKKLDIADRFNDSEEYNKDVTAAVKLEKEAKHVGVGLEMVMMTHALQSIPTNRDLEDDFIQYYLKQIIPHCKHKTQVESIVFIGEPTTYFIGDSRVAQSIKTDWRPHVIDSMKSKSIHIYPTSNNNHWWLNIFVRSSVTNDKGFPLFEHFVIESFNSDHYVQEGSMAFARRVNAAMNGYINSKLKIDEFAKISYVTKRFMLPYGATQHSGEHTCALWLVHYVEVFLNLPIFSDISSFSNNSFKSGSFLVDEVGKYRDQFITSINTLRDKWKLRVESDLQQLLIDHPDQKLFINLKTNKLYSEEQAAAQKKKIKMDNIIKPHSTYSTRSSDLTDTKVIKGDLSKLLKGEILVQHLNELLVNLYNLITFKDSKNLAKGLGVKVNRAQPIQPGSIVLFYEGVRRTADDMNEKIKEYKRKGLGSYVITFEPKRGQTLFNPKTKKFYNIVAIDATEPDDIKYSLGRYVNDAHISKKKCNLKLKVYKSQDNTQVYIAMVATKVIKKDDELFFDYGDKDDNALYWRETAKEDHADELSLSATQLKHSGVISLAFIFTLFANANLIEFSRFMLPFKTDIRSVNRLDKALLKSYRSFHEYLFGLVENITALYEMLPKLNKLLKKRVNLMITICYDFESIKALDQYYQSWNNSTKSSSRSYQALFEKILSIKQVTTSQGNTLYVRGVDWTSLFNSFIPIESKLADDNDVTLKQDILQCFHRYYEGFVGESSNCDFICLADADLVIETEKEKEGNKFSEFLFQWLKECNSDKNNNNSMYQSLLRFFDGSGETSTCYTEWPLLGGQFCWRRLFLEDIVGAQKSDFHKLMKEWIEQRSSNYESDGKSSKSPFNYESDQLFLKEILFGAIEKNIKKMETNNLIKSIPVHIQFRKGDTSNHKSITLPVYCQGKINFDSMYESSHTRMEELILANRRLSEILSKSRIEEGYDSYFVDYAYYDASWQIIDIQLGNLMYVFGD